MVPSFCAKSGLVRGPLGAEDRLRDSLSKPGPAGGPLKGPWRQEVGHDCAAGQINGFVDMGEEVGRSNPSTISHPHLGIMA